MQSNNNYTTVFLHGLGGWGDGDPLNERMSYWGYGETERSLLPHLRSLGYEVYNPSLGPVTSAWDRACELWAYLVGGTVDFGAVHSRKHKHKRFGKTYPGVLRDLGTDGNHAKINLIGHSYGGPTAILFADLLTNGCAEERKGTPADELSPLFQGGHHCIHALVTLSGANNGSTFADFFGVKGIYALTNAIFGYNAIAAQKGKQTQMDFHTEQWGISDRENTFTDKLLGIRHLKQSGCDHMGFSLQIQTAAENNQRLSPDPQTYYFAYRACRTHEDWHGHHVPNRDMRKILKIYSTVIGRFLPDRLRKAGADEHWLASDGIVNVVSQGAPFSVESRAFDGNFDQVQPGIWYNMPVENKHHMSWVGIGEDREKFFAFYDTLLHTLCTFSTGKESVS